MIKKIILLVVVTAFFLPLVQAQVPQSFSFLGETFELKNVEYGVYTYKGSRKNNLFFHEGPIHREVETIPQKLTESWSRILYSGYCGEDDFLMQGYASDPEYIAMVRANENGVILLALYDTSQRMPSADILRQYRQAMCRLQF